MPKKTTILIIILAVITGVLIFFAIKSDKAQDLLVKSQNTMVSPTLPPVFPFATLSFTTPTIDMTLPGTPMTQTVDILLNTVEKGVSGAQIELLFDPKLVTNVKFLTPKNSLPFFGKDQSVLINSVDITQGRASYAVGVPLQGSEKSGNSSVVSLTFTVNKVPEIASTSITFLPKSTVATTSTPGSMLKSTAPLTIIFNK